MRAAIGALLLLLAFGAALSHDRVAAAINESCQLRSTRTQLRLPASVTITTSCGAFVIGRDGRVRRTSTDPSPVPQGTSWWPYTGVWDKLVGGHLIVGRWQKQVWRSSGTFRIAYQIGVITIGPHALAFSYGDRSPHLYLAPLHGSERQLATGEYPVGWTRGGFYTRTVRGGALLLRSATGERQETLARRVSTYAYDEASGSLYLTANGVLVRADGRAQRPIASLSKLGFPRRGYLQIQPLGKLIALESALRLVVLHSDGTLFASTRLPHGRTRHDTISSQLAASPSAQAVAFTATRGNTAYGSNGIETVYLLRPGDRAARLIHREWVSFAICERGASVAWHGRWLLYSASEGNTAVIDTDRPRHVLELTRLVRRLPGLASDEGNLDLTVSWARQPTGV
jgi:hypothetical protein